MALTFGREVRRAEARRFSALGRRPRGMLTLLVLAVLCLFGIALLGNEGQLTVTSEPPGATVSLDGRYVGVTPFVVSTRFIERSGRLEIRAPGRSPVTRRFVLQPGAKDSLHVSLPPAAVEGGAVVKSEPSTAGGSVRVESQPPGATVWLDGDERGRTPLVLNDVAPGRHELRLVAPRYEPATRSVDIESRKLSEVAVTLQRVALPAGSSRPPGRPPVVVMVENHPDARPQTGLDRADVIYEALVEGGVTRFMAVYSTTDAEVVGPVRSMRDYYVYWASEYQPIFAHIGGSPQSYNAIAATGVRHFEESPAYGYWRSRERYAPHNAYLDTAAVRAAAERLGMLGKGAFAALVQHPDWPVPRSEAASRVFVTYPGGYRVAWIYDQATKHYRRSMDGHAHVDAATGEQLAARALILQRVSTRSIDAEDRQAMEVVGQGKIAYVIDGQAGVGTWRKASPTAPTYFYDAAGERLVLPPGQVWIQVLPPQAPLDWE